MRTSTEEYLEKLKKLQDGTIKKMTQTPSDEPRFIIDSNTRKITIPDDFTFLGVKNDSYAETIYFEIDRYFDAEDLTKHTIIVQYCSETVSDDEEEDYPIGIDIVTDIDIETVPGKIIFGWTIKNEATFLAAEIAFSIRFYTIDGETNKFSYSFNTLTSALPVLDTLNVSQAAVDRYVNILDAWLKKMQSIQDYIDSLDLEVLEGKAGEARNSALIASASAESAKESAEKAKNSETASAASAAEIANNLVEARNIKTQIDALDESVRTNAASSAENAENAKSSEDAAKLAEGNAKSSETKAKTSEDNAKKSEESAVTSATSATESKNAAANSETKAKASEEASKLSETNSKKSENASKKSADDAAASLQELKDGIASGNFKGADGLSPTVDVEDISGGHRLTITDVNAKKTVDVLNGKDGLPGDATIDDTAVSGRYVWSSLKTIDTLCDPINETGNPVTCYPVENYPLGVTVSWEPIQSGTNDPSPENVRPIHGRDSVSVTRCGENLAIDVPLNPTRTLQYIYFQRLQGETVSLSFHLKGSFNHESASAAILDFYNSVEDGHTYRSFKQLCEANGIDYTTGTVDADFRLTVTTTFDRIGLYFVYSGFARFSTDSQLTDFMLVRGSSPIAYTPYLGNVYTLTLPNAIYGGTLDILTGEAKQTWGSLNIANTSFEEGKSSAGWAQSEDAVVWFTYGDVLGKETRLICNILASVGNQIVSTAIPYTIGYDNKYIAVRLPRSVAATGQDVANWLTTNNAKIVYKMETPSDISATGFQQIPAISGVNTVVSNADSVTVTGRAIPEKNRNQDLTTDILFKYPRTGKVYTTKIPRFASNPTTTCEKLDDNSELVCEASTDTTENRDDYENIPLFKWYNCNYLRDEYGHAYPTAIEGINDNYRTDGSVDVGVIQMTPYVKWDESNDDYVLLSITDTPKEGFTAWTSAVSNGVVYPYVIHSKYISGIASDGLLRSQPNLKPARLQSYINMITNYGKKGSGYFGAGEERNAWQIIFTLIKYANKSSQAIFAGVASYSFQYDASIQRSENLTYFPVTKAQAANIIVGNYVSVGYGHLSSGSVNKDRYYSELHKYADDVKVLKVEELDDNNSAVYLDVKDGFDTMPVAISDTVNSTVVLSSMHSWSGTTDSVKSHHDGSAGSNTNSEHPYRVQGVEYMVGGWTVSSDVVAVFNDDGTKDIYVCPRGTKRVSTTATILSRYTNVGKVPSGGFYVGDIGFDVKFGVAFSKTKGSGLATGVGDYNYDSTGSKNVTREYLRGGYLGYGSAAGSSFVHFGGGLGYAGWGYLSAD